MWPLFLIVLCKFGFSYCSKTWDLLIFTQHWPNSVCLEYEESGPNHICALPPRSGMWTVHGVWPTKLHTEGPSFCNSSMKFDPQKLQSIREQLLIVWPNLQSGKDVNSLWVHEWMKHGTCAVSLNSLNSEDKYFGQGLKWFQNYDMTSILTAGGIPPSDVQAYRLTDINDALLKSLGVRAHIACVTERHTKIPYLFELRICFDKALNLVDCDGTVISESDILGNCPMNQLIKYPRSLPPLPTPPPVKDSSLITLFRVLSILSWF